ncbi:hypothetical protein [uncultured Stenotrophomonas sp.]|uniref:hypothetical protein n=1 Tax=uncultured Stenotrophomonas sp. TaxID=165438 RepID=UPI0028D3A8A5|nr:hypothetical protein [uncultured Stenotrophomonas sp.]
MKGNTSPREITFFFNLGLSLERPDAKRHWIVRRDGEQLEPTFPSKAAAIRHWERALLQLAQSDHFFETLARKAETWKWEEIEPIITWLTAPGSPYPPVLSEMQGVAFEPTKQWRHKASKIYKKHKKIGTDAEIILRKNTSSILRASKYAMVKKDACARKPTRLT